MPGSTTNNGSYSNKGAIIGGIAGGAAAVGGLLYWIHHHRAKLVGCLQGNGDQLVSDKDNQTYAIANQQNEPLKPGERVDLSGKKSKGDTGEPTFEVHKMNKDLGQCTATSAGSHQQPAPRYAKGASRECRGHVQLPPAHPLDIGAVPL